MTVTKDLLDMALIYFISFHFVYTLSNDIFSSSDFTASNEIKQN
jgi:hypothetical protein